MEVAAPENTAANGIILHGGGTSRGCDEPISGSQGRRETVRLVQGWRPRRPRGTVESGDGGVGTGAHSVSNGVRKALGGVVVVCGLALYTSFLLRKKECFSAEGTHQGMLIGDAGLLRFDKRCLLVTVVWLSCARDLLCLRHGSSLDTSFFSVDLYQVSSQKSEHRRTNNTENHTALS